VASQKVIHVETVAVVRSSALALYSHGQPYWGRKACRNGPIFVRSSSALKKESIAHFSIFLANCLWHHQNSGAQNGKY